MTVQTPRVAPPGMGAARLAGAEAVVEAATYLGRPVLAKRRLAKGYRHPRLDEAIRAARTRDEAHLLATARRAGVPVPVVVDVDREGTTLLMERLPGATLQEELARDGDEAAIARMRALGATVGRLHDAGLTHGDLTTRNVVVPDPGDAARVVLIDFGLGAFSEDAEARGVDLHILEEALEATEARATLLRDAFLQGYGAARSAPAALARLEQVRSRGRYK